MKLLWVSNAPWVSSGYGSQTRQVGRRLAAAGHTVEYAANDGTKGDHEWEGALVRGSGFDRYSRDTLRADFDRSGADYAFILYDPWVYTERGMTDPLAGVPEVANWTPVDHYPLSVDMIPWLREHRAIAMSQFGRDQLTEASERLRARTGRGFPVAYAPHAIEAVFRPTPLYPRAERPFRELIGVPADAFLVGIVAANTGESIYPRKGWGDMLLALVPFLQRHDDAFVYLHTVLDNRASAGVDLRSYMAVLGISQDRVRVVDEYAFKKQAIDDAAMAAIYTSFDVHMLTSRGEGFGLPVIESLACGVPNIVSNWTAQAELVGDAPWNPANPHAARTPRGWMVGVQPDMAPARMSAYGKPMIGEVTLALEDAYQRRGDQAMRAAAEARGREYDADAVFDAHWRPILADIEADLDRLRAAKAKREARNAKRRAA